MTLSARRANSAFIAPAALVMAALAVFLAVALARHATIDLRVERTAWLEAQADQALLAAAAWAREHDAEISADAPTSVPIDALLPASTRGTLEMLRQRAPRGDGEEILARIRLTGRGQALSRTATWPARDRRPGSATP